MYSSRFYRNFGYAALFLLILNGSFLVAKLAHILTITTPMWVTWVGVLTAIISVYAFHRLEIATQRKIGD